MQEKCGDCNQFFPKEWLIRGHISGAIRHKDKAYCSKRCLESALLKQINAGTLVDVKGHVTCSSCKETFPTNWLNFPHISDARHEDGKYYCSGKCLDAIPVA